MKQKIRKIIIFTYTICVKINFHYAAAYILALLTKPVSEGGKYRILCLNKSIFSEDLKAIEAVSPDLCFLSFPRLLLSEYVKKHVNNFEKLNDGSYHAILHETEEQKNIHQDIHRLFPHLLKRLKFDAIFAGNYVYVSQQELFKVAQDWHIPVIILYKEGIFASVNLSDSVRDKFFSNKRFYGDKLLFYNRITQQILLEADVPGVDENKTSVVGIPRLDKYKLNDSNKANGKTITLFSFESEMKTKRLINDKSRIPEYNRLGEEFQFYFIRFCLENPDYHLTIKTKSTSAARNGIKLLLEKNDLDYLPPDIRITQDDNPYDLIRNSTFVAGYFSTTLLEAMMLGKPILIPFFEDISKNPKTDIFASDPEAVNYIRDYESAVQLLSGNVKAKLPTRERMLELLEPYVFSLDGQASNRVEHEIINQIIRQRRAEIQ